MAYLIVAGVTVPVAMSMRPKTEYEEIGDRGTTFNGTERETIRTRKRNIPEITTAPMPSASATTLVNALKGAPPLACSGTLLGGSVNCHAKAIFTTNITLSAAEYVVVTFTLREI